MEDLSFPSINTSNDFMDPTRTLKNFDQNDSYSPTNPKKKPRIRKMYIAALSALSFFFALGLASGYSAPACYDMEIRTNSALHPNKEEITWITSIIALGAIAGTFFAGPLADKIGRKDTLMLSIIPSGVGWLMICYATSVAQIIIGRFICGFAVGIINMAGAVYCVEISTPEVRGILGAACQGFLVIGNLLSGTLGYYLSWRQLALNGAVFATLATISFIPMPESPRWLLANGKLQEAKRVMNYLQGGYVDTEKECNAIYRDLQKEPKGMLTFQELKNPAVYKPAIIGFWITMFLEFSGVNAIFLYSSDIFKQAGAYFDPKISTIILGAVQVVATLTANSVTDKFGRKILLIISGALMCVTLATMGIFFYFSSNPDFNQRFGWLPLTSLMLCVVGYSVGYGPIPRLLAAETVPTRARSTVNSMINILNGVSVFIVVKTFPLLEDVLGRHGAFWLYSCINAVGIFYVLFAVPETKGKKLEEIEKLFQKPNGNSRGIHINVIS